MDRKLLLKVLVPLVAILAAVPALAQYPRDKAALSKIDEAINQHYLATEFDQAEALLTGTVVACADKCSPGVIAKAWMYVGLVRGSGKQDLQGATEAFTRALSADGGVSLDESLASPEVRDAFVAAGGVLGGKPAEPGPQPGKSPAREDAPANLECEPEVKEVQTRRPIPLVCVTDEDATRMEIRYQESARGGWKTATMQKVGDEFRGQIPCTASKSPGAISFYVRALDRGGDTVDTYGTRSKPISVTVAAQVESEPPAFPGEAPPPRCEEEADCPPDFPGCGKNKGQMCGDKDWGASCQTSKECKCGLLCIEGSCETAPTCSKDTDCPVGECVAGKCALRGEEDEPAGPYKTNWFSLHVAQDFALLPATPEACVPAYQGVGGPSEGWACYYANTDSPYVGEPYPNDTDTPSGFAMATTRVLLGYDRALSDRITLGARGGFAFGGGPPAGKVEEDPIAGIGAKAGNPFLPLHLEGRGTFWITSLSKLGARPYVNLSGGLAQVDAKVQIKGARDCLASFPDPMSAAYNQCVAGTTNNQTFLNSEGDDLDAFRKMGQGFVGGGAGLVYAFDPSMGIQLNVNAMIMLPTSGFVVEPSLGFVYGL